MNAIPTHFSVAGDALTTGSAGVGAAAQRLVRRCKLNRCNLC
jgi:hypothetical protein